MTLKTKRERIAAANFYPALFGGGPINPMPEPRTRRPADPPQPTESQIQKAIIAWWHLECRNHKLPEFALYAVPNGGARDAITGSRMKMEGVRRGMPDLNLDVPRGSYHGLRMELKRHGGRVSDEQDAVMAYLDEQGYFVVICWSVDEARAEITKYLRNFFA